MKVYLAILFFSAPFSSMGESGDAESSMARVDQTALQLGYARDHFFAEDYRSARTMFNLILHHPGVDEQLVAEAHRYLAVLDFIDGDSDAAREHIVNAIAIDRDVEPPEGTTPAIVELFDAARQGAAEESVEEPSEDTAEVVPEAEPSPVALPEPEIDGSGNDEGRSPDQPSREVERSSGESLEAWVSLAPKIGLSVASIFNEMPPNVMAELELGLLLPVWDRRLSLVFAGAYSPPGRRGEGFHEDLGESGHAFSFSMTNHQLLLSLGLTLRFLPPGSRRFVPYAGVFGRLYFLRTNVIGEAEGVDFGESFESSMRAGVSAMLGVEIKAGPGGFLVETSFGWSLLTHEITGETSTGAISVVLGYRIFL